jgi:hypothetical protein
VADYSLPEAAARLGTSTEAVRARVKRKSLDGYRDNRGRWRVCLPDGEGSDQTPDQTAAEVASGRVSGREEGASGRVPTDGEARERVAFLEGKLEGLEARLTDRDRELAALRAERDELLSMLREAQAGLVQQSQGLSLKRVWRKFFGSRA